MRRRRLTPPRPLLILAIAVLLAISLPVIIVVAHLAIRAWRWVGF